ncbi:hypothetical protein KN1_10890 [Stygiolobus caldivivus]|uniref:Uncharacterized protein n=2 Tax=Stygiolobus caldivivus TaxID=2824673 RepID=A0A8D5U5S8_9CREN|nr:hypothetical protein KN1_10890 [Stygiolobus caldivivus]
MGFILRSLFFAKKFVIFTLIYVLFSISLFVSFKYYTEFYADVGPLKNVLLFTLILASYNIWFSTSILFSAYSSTVIPEDIGKEAHYIFLKSVYKSLFRKYVWYKAITVLAFLTVLGSTSSLLLFVLVSPPIQSFTVGDYERLLVLFLLLSTVPVASTLAFTSFVPDEKVALLFTIAIYFFVNVFMGGYYLVKYAANATPYVLFTLPIYLPTALHDWGEVYAQAKTAYNEVSGVALPYVDYNVILNTLLLYSIVSIIFMVIGIETNLRRKGN